jgi:hypothetical protein
MAQGSSDTVYPFSRKKCNIFLFPQPFRLVGLQLETPYIAILPAP